MLLLINKPTLEAAVALNKVLKPDEALSILVDADSGEIVIGTRFCFMVVQPPSAATRSAFPFELIEDAGEFINHEPGSKIVLPGDMLAELIKALPKGRDEHCAAVGSSPGVTGQVKAVIVDGKAVKAFTAPMPVGFLSSWRDMLATIWDSHGSAMWDFKAGIGVADFNFRSVVLPKLWEGVGVAAKLSRELSTNEPPQDWTVVHYARTTTPFILRMKHVVLLLRPVVIDHPDEIPNFSEWEQSCFNHTIPDMPAFMRNPGPMTPKQLPPLQVQYQEPPEESLAASIRRNKLPPKKAPPPRKLPPRKTG